MSNTEDHDHDCLGNVDRQALWVTLFVADTLVAEGNSSEHDRLEGLVTRLSQELDARYPTDGESDNATERTADWVTGHHMSGDDAVRWALHSFDHLERVASGEVRRG